MKSIKPNKYIQIFTITNGYKHLQPILNVLQPIKVFKSPHLCTVEIKQSQFKKLLHY
jgi:hypothetical protein